MVIRFVVRPRGSRVRMSFVSTMHGFRRIVGARLLVVKMYRIVMMKDNVVNRFPVPEQKGWISDVGEVQL